MDAYRKEEDNFYFNQLYDRYIQRVYDVVPCETVQNVPMDTLDALKQRYQFIVVEQGKAADLTGARKICCVCQEWCQSAVSVKCAGCQKSYHMACLNPPLLRKPSKGFAWQCAFCTRQEIFHPQVNNIAKDHKMDFDLQQAEPQQQQQQQQQQQEKQQSIKSSKSDSKRQLRATRSQATPPLPSPAITTIVQPQKLETSIKLKINPKKGGLKNQQMKMTHMWPFRYFGINTNIGDILDVDDRIYPRAKSRIGARYQATVLDWDTTNNRSLSPSSSDIQSPKAPSSKSKKEKKKLNVQSKSNGYSKRSAETSPSAEPMDFDSSESMIPVRGGDETITCIYRPDVIADEQVDDYMDLVKDLKSLSLSPQSSDLMDRALFELELNTYHTDQAFENMADLHDSDFKHIVYWTQKEIDAFEQSIREHGHDLNFAKASVKTKSMADIVRYFYQWKKTERYETVYSDWTKIYRPMKKFKKFPRNKDTNAKLKKEEDERDLESEEEEADPTIVPKATYAKRAYQCMNCLTDESKIWRRPPSDFDRKRKIFHKVLCNDCGIYWLKYAQSKTISVEKKNANAIATTGLLALQNLNLNVMSDEERKRKKSTTDGMKLIVKRFKESNVPAPLSFEPTSCKVCLHSNPPEKLYTCYGCGMSVHTDCYGIGEGTDEVGWLCDPCDNKIHPVASYVYECVLCFKSAKETQQPLKRTAGYYWAHVQCATFIPEIKFVHPSLLSPIEYIGCVNMARLEAKCQLCDVQRGACVSCSECRKTVHVQCAIDHDFKLAFEIQPNTHNSNRLTKYPIVAAGLFGPLSPSGLMVPQVWCPSHSLASRKLIELHTRTTDNTQESSLMTYVKKYKCIARGTTPAMRRFKATSHHHLNGVLAQRKIPNPRDAVLEALTIDDQIRETTPTITKITLTTTPTPRKNTIHNIKKRVCSTVGCSVQHTPIWWSVDDSTDKKICHRCHGKM
ncbi:unnamed protein product [Mucor hiemalis]